ncbi:MAG TPA: CDP-glycerol glycerophosphotransferase family protein [Vicinamibacterales bacterium]|nr:CDP-glycerol glycerophosphotransferase family protein [Vicinamibacterales bacterium]
MRWLRELLTRADRAIARLTGRRRVLIDARTPMNFAVLAPIFERLQRDPRVHCIFTAADPAKCAETAAAVGVRGRIHPRSAMRWRRLDAALSADPWDPVVLRRCLARINFFHGVAGKYDLDSPGHLPIDFGQYDRVCFVNADRMRRYLAAGVVSRESAVLAGYPKMDALANGRYDAAAVHARLQLEMHRRTAIYAPTWSTASSLHIAGEAIVENLIASGFNVIIKLHDRSLDTTEPKFSGGIDWRARFARLHQPGRVAFVEAADASPLLAASDVMVTDHSSIGFEFCLLDRPLIVFDAPDLPRVARINPEKVAQLRGAARVVATAADVGPAAIEELANAGRLAEARRAIVHELFYEPGTATERALSVVYERLALPRPLLQVGARMPADAASLT